MHAKEKGVQFFGEQLDSEGRGPESSVLEAAAEGYPLPRQCLFWFDFFIVSVHTGRFHTLSMDFDLSDTDHTESVRWEGGGKHYEREWQWISSLTFASPACRDCSDVRRRHE